jgi:hypothetical protein
MSLVTRPPAHGDAVAREHPRPSGLAGWSLGAVLVVLIAAGVALGVLREPVLLDPQTPEGTVQSYVQAVLDGEWNDARTHLADDLEAECTAIDFRRSWVPGSLTATLDEVRVDGDEAEVVIRLRTAAEPDPFGGRYENTEIFDLIREDTTWRLTGQPWPVYDCGGW